MKNKKLVFLTLGTKGDLYPLLGLAVEFRKRGYQTLMLSSEEHRAVCEQEGIEFDGLLSIEERQAQLNHPDIWKPGKGLKLYFRETVLRTAERAYRAIERQAEEHDCVLVCNNIMVSGLLAWERLGIPTASVFLHPFSHVSHVEPAKDTALRNFILKVIGVRGRKMLIGHMKRDLNASLSPINALRQAVGLNPIRDILDEWRHSVPLILDLWPDSYCPAKVDWPAQAVRTGFVDYDGPPQAAQSWIEHYQLADFLAEKPIVFTMGTGMVQNFDAQLSLFSTACRLLGRKGLLVSASAKGMGSIRVDGDFVAIEAAPFSELFPMTSVVVTHGGIGTVARAFKCGCPLMVTPMAFDQFDNGHHVERLGVGKCLPWDSLTSRKLARALRDILADTGIRERCDRLRLEMGHEDGTQRACDLIESRLIDVAHESLKAAKA